MGRRTEGSVPPLTGVGLAAKPGSLRAKDRRMMATKHLRVLSNVDVFLDRQNRGPCYLFQFLKVLEPGKQIHQFSED
jgi:hypothetical protein